MTYPASLSRHRLRSPREMTHSTQTKTRRIMITDEQITRFISEAHRIADAGLTVCSSGNISWRTGEEALITGTGSWIPTLSAGQISVCNVSTGAVLNGVRPSMESGFHLGIMRERPEINVVLHFQSPYATAVACLKDIPDNFNVTLEMPYHVGSEIPVIPYFRPGSAELAEHVTRAMKDHDTVLMRNHGQVVCGKDFDEVIERAMFFEMACRIIILTNGNYTTLSEKDILEMEQLKRQKTQNKTEV